MGVHARMASTALPVCVVLGIRESTVLLKSMSVPPHPALIMVHVQMKYPISNVGAHQNSKVR